MINNLPNGWRIEELKNISDFINGFAFKSSEFKEIGIPIVRIGNLINDKINLIDSVSYDKDEKLTSYIILKDDILIAMSGATTGKLAYNEYSSEMYLNQRIGSIRVKKDIYSKYLFNFLKGKKDYLLSLAGGSAQPNLSSNDIKKIKVPIPPLQQQERIVKVLDLSSNLIEKQKELLKNYDLFLKSKFIEMFGCPAENEKKWEIKTIEQIVKKDKHSIKRGPFGGALKKEIFIKEGYLVYEQFHALNNDFSFARYFIDEEKFNELKSFEVKSGDIIISCSGVYLGKLAIIPNNAKKGIINQALLKISLDNEKINNLFFTYIFTNINFKKKFFGSNIGSGIPNFPPMSDFKKFQFINPPIELQNKFASIVEKIEIIKEKENQKLKQFEDLHNSLMQKAFKGEIE